MAGSLIETHRSFVNTWECDENDHMNVQFYLKRFDEAARFHHLAGGGRHDGGLPTVRHVRYHSELRRAQSVVIRSAMIEGGAFNGWAVHRMSDEASGRLCATALDSPDPECTGPGIVTETAIPEALPRSVNAKAGAPESPQTLLQRGGLISHRCIVPPAECAADGTMLEQFFVARFTDGAPHVWDHSGIGTGWLSANGFGRVAVEMKLTHHKPVRSGDAIMLYSALLASEGKTVRLRHELVRATDQTPLASGDVIALVMDLSTRKAVALPDDIRQQLART